jgi:hypothetical protein
MIHPNDTFLEHIAQGNHSVYAVTGVVQPFAYSIGVYYFHNLPEICVRMANTPNNATSKHNYLLT